jgi:hypothetical protein
MVVQDTNGNPPARRAVFVRSPRDPASYVRELPTSPGPPGLRRRSGPAQSDEGWPLLDAPLRTPHNRGRDAYAAIRGGRRPRVTARPMRSTGERGWPRRGITQPCCVGTAYGSLADRDAQALVQAQALTRAALVPIAGPPGRISPLPTPGPRNLPDVQGRGHRGPARRGRRLPRGHPARDSAAS